MKKKSKVITKKKKKQTQVSSGFTLIELLAMIAILSVILSIVIYFAMDIVGNAKKKSYQVTVNNIEAQAGNYVLDGFTSMIWIPGGDSSYQYQCVTVKNLIDAGYFKGDVLESKVDDDRFVLDTDYVYLERDSSSKTITKNVLLVGKGASYAGLCSAISATGRINMSVNPTGWIKTKKVITIDYRLYNYGDVSNYVYDYIFENDKGVVVEDFSETSFASSSIKETVEVIENGTLCAMIKKKSDGTLIASKCQDITGIDKVAPTGTILSTNNVSGKQTVTLTMKDNASGVDMYYFGKSNPNTSSVEWIAVENANSITKTTVVDSEGKYYLGIKDAVGNQSVVDADFYKTILSINNGSVTPNVIITKLGNSFTIPTGIADAYYTFNGWYTSSSYSGSTITNYTPLANASYTNTLYGKTTENRLTGGVVTISGTNAYGETLTASITQHTTPQADKYAYQWYMNSSNSTTGGTAISGATKNTLILQKEQVGKYIYVVVTATKNNYKSTKFSDITDAKVGKRNITVLADSSSKVYDGIALTDSSCTISNGSLAFNDSISCKMTNASIITNVGEKINEISEVTVWNDNKTSKNTDVYNITKKNGVLKITYKQVSVPICNIGLVYNGSTQELVSNSETGYLIENRTAVNAGNYIVIAKLSSNYEWTDGTIDDKILNCNIEKAVPQMTVNPSKLSLVFPTTGNVSYTYNGDGKLSCSSSSERIATCRIDTSTNNIVVTPLKNGDITMTLYAAESTNYKAISREVYVGSSATYVVSYDANDCGVAPNIQNTVHDDATIISSMVNVNSGKKFIEWNTKVDGTGIAYNVGDNYLSSDNKDLKLYAQCNTNKVNINYTLNGGDLKSITTSSSGTVYNWSYSNDIIYRDGSVYATTINYGSSIGTYGLVDYNNDSHLYITKEGYKTPSNSEWVCLKGSCNGRVYSQSEIYNHNDFCDASNNDCTVVLGVNWKDLTPPTIEFGTDGSNDKWVKTAESIITVSDDGSGVDESKLKYIFSQNSSDLTTKSFVNDGTVRLSGANGIYYLIASACDNDNNCTTTISKPFKLDNIPPVVTCNKSKAWWYQDIIGSNFSEDYVVSPDRIQDGYVYINLYDTVDYTYISNEKYDITKDSDYDADCTVFLHMYFRNGNQRDYAEYNDGLFNVTDNSGVINEKNYRTSYQSYDDDGNSTCSDGTGSSCLWKATRCNCLNGYCLLKIGHRAYDEAGNVSSYKYFYYYWTYNGVTKALPQDGNFIWTINKLRKTYCKYDSEVGSYVSVSTNYNCTES